MGRTDEVTRRGSVYSAYSAGEGTPGRSKAGALTGHLQADAHAPVEPPLRAKHVHVRDPHLLDGAHLVAVLLVPRDADLAPRLPGRGRHVVERVELARVGVADARGGVRRLGGFLDARVEEHVEGFVLVLLGAQEVGRGHERGGTRGRARQSGAAQDRERESTTHDRHVALEAQARVVRQDCTHVHSCQLLRGRGRGDEARAKRATHSSLSARGGARACLLRASRPTGPPWPRSVSCTGTSISTRSLPDRRHRAERPERERELAAPRPCPNRAAHRTPRANRRPRA